MIHDTTINDLTFYVMAGVDVIALSIYLIVYSLLRRLTDSEEEEYKPKTKIGKWINEKGLKLLNIARKLKLKFVLYVFVAYGAIVLVNRSLFELSNSALTDIELVSFINANLLYGAVIFSIPFLDKIQLFKKRKSINQIKQQTT